MISLPFLKDQLSFISKSGLLCVLLIVAGCGSPVSAPTLELERNVGSLRIKGSDTMLPLVRLWGEAFMKRYPSVSVYAEGGGSRLGIEALISGRTDVCAASRNMTAAEIKQLHARRGTLGMSVLSAKDALSVYLHPENPVRNLSTEQLRRIFRGRIKNWKEVGGEDLPITVVNRQPNSGTYLFFQNFVLQAEAYTSTAQIKPTTRAVVQAITENRSAIGYGGLAYGSDLFHCPIDGAAPTTVNVKNGTYPLARYLYLYTAKAPDGMLKRFVDFVLSDDGQALVHEAGYIPLWDSDTP